LTEIFEPCASCGSDGSAPTATHKPNHRIVPPNVHRLCTCSGRPSLFPDAHLLRYLKGSRFDPKMAFDNAHDFKIDTANMGTTNNGPLMFWNNTYHPGSVHNHAVVTSGTPTTFYMGGAAPPPPPPPRIQERDRSDYSWDNRSEFTDTSSRGRPPPQQPPYESPPPALGAPRGPGSPASESASSYQPQHYPRSSEASPQPQHAEASNSDRDYYDPPRAEGMGQPSEARLASPEAEAIPARPTESLPPRESELREKTMPHSKTELP
jgi:hypothetical protein